MSMRRWLLPFTALCAFHASAHALGLGAIKVNSALNDPFDATIELTGTIDATDEQLLAKLGTDEDFARAGATREQVLLLLQFKPELGNHPPVIHVSSQKPIREPFLDFVLSVQTPRAQLQKEYTVLLNPTPTK